MGSLSPAISLPRRMDGYINVFLMIVACLLSINLTDAGVIVKGDFFCGETATIVCEITPYNKLITWKVNNINVAQCAFSSCNALPAIPSDHTFSHDEATGQFNLTITNVSYSNNGTIYKCDDGTVADQTIAVVKALPKATDTSLNEANRVITVKTDCVYPPGEVSVTWYCVTGGQETMLQQNKMTADVVDCTTGDCAGSGIRDASGSINTEGLNTGSSSYKAKVFIDGYESRSISVISAASYQCDSCVCNCSCTFGGGEKGFTAIDYLLDVVYTVVVVWLTCKFFAKVWKPEDVHKHAILGLSTLAVVLLDIGYTILLFLGKNDDSEDCKPECKKECGCCTHTLRVALTVVAWLLDFGGYGMILYYIFNRAGCKCPQLCIPDSPAGPAGKPPGSVKPAGGQRVYKTPGNKHFTRDGRDQGHAMNDVTKNGGKGRPQPLPPQASSRPLPSIGGGGTGKRGLSANFEDNGEMTPMDGRGGQRLRTLKPPQASIAENDETEKKKKKKKKKRKTDDNDGTEMD